MPSGLWARCIWALPGVDKAYVKKLFVSRPDRTLIRARAAQTALEMALRLAQGKSPLPVRRCWPKAHSMTPPP